jgi:putative flippase GtrA
VDAASAVAEMTAAADVAGRPWTPRRLYERFQDFIHEVSKFGLVGIVAFVVDVTVFNVLLTRFHVETLLSGAISMVISATIAFVGNRFWTWRHRERSGLHREYAMYFMFNLGGLLITLTCLGLSHYGLGAIWPFFTGRLADNIAKNLVGTAFGTLFRFWSYRRFVFRATAVDAPPVV